MNESLKFHSEYHARPTGDEQVHRALTMVNAAAAASKQPATERIASDNGREMLALFVRIFNRNRQYVDLLFSSVKRKCL
jgi:hypothetical protein